MSSSQLLPPVFSSLIGISVSFLLLILLYREKQKDPGIKVGMLLGGVVIVFFGSLSATAVLTFERVPRSTGIWAVSAVAVAMSSAVLPSLVLWSWHVSPVLRWRSRQSRAMLCVSWLWTVAVIAFSLIKPGPRQVSYLNQVVGFSSVISLAPACISILRLPLDRRLHVFMRSTYLIYLASALLSLFVPPWNKPPTPGLLLIAHLRLTLLLIALFGSFVLSARFRLADTFVRWGARITLGGAFAMLGTLFFSAAFSLPLGTHSPLALITLASVTCAVLLFGNVAISRYGLWVERTVLGKVDMYDALSRFRSLLFSQTDQPFLFATTQTALARALQVEAVRLVDAEEVPREINVSEIQERSVMDVPSRFQPLSISTQENVEYLAPIVVNKSTKYVAVISPGLRRRALVSSEIRFVEETTEQLGFRLEHIEAESRAYLQSLQESLLHQQLAEAELRALRAQINPHFLFNSLNTIADLIMRNPDGAERLTVRLSQIFRHVLARSSKQFVTLSEEFSFLGNYLDIEQERFGEGMLVQFELHKDAEQVLIPSLLLQPLVENALKHGLAPKLGSKELVLKANLKGSRVHFEICDNGVGFPEVTMFTSGSGRELSLGGVGLTNTFARLRTAFGADAEMQLQSAPLSGCRITLSFEARHTCAV